jgi:hypothetical protein
MAAHTASSPTKDGADKEDVVASVERAVGLALQRVFALQALYDDSGVVHEASAGRVASLTAELAVRLD